jgi:hypothetical protein
MVTRLTSIDYNETPISSEKYNRETNHIYENLNAALSFNTQLTPPTDVYDGLIWYDANYVPPLMKRWSDIEQVWQWGGNYIYGPTTPPVPDYPMKGATRFNEITGATEYWTGTIWMAVSIEGLGATFSGNGAYLWDKEPKLPDRMFYPVIGVGYDINQNSVQSGSSASEYKDCFVIGGNARQMKESLVYSLNAGTTDWLPVINLEGCLREDAVPDTYINEVCTVETIIGYNGDYSLPSNMTDTPFVFAIIRTATGETTGMHYVVAIRVTDNGAQLAGQAIKAILIPDGLTNQPLAACIQNGELKLGGKDATNVPTIWTISWTANNVQLSNATQQLVGYEGSVTGLVNYYTVNNLAGILDDGRQFGYVQAQLLVDSGPGEPCLRMGFIQPDNRLIAVGVSGKVYEGKDGNSGRLPTWNPIESFDGVEARALDSQVSSKRHTELLVGSVQMYGIDYGAIFEKKIGSSDYQVVWQSDADDIACSLVYCAIRNSFLTLGRNRVTGELEGIYDSDLRSVSDYFASINRQLQTLTSIVNKAMYRGGAKKGEIRAWTQPVNLIPEGWALCDGRFNAEYGGVVPNLSGRFLRGSVSAGEAVLVTGGADSVVLTTDNLAPHTHGLANHTHNITAVSHTHSMNHTHSYTGGAHSHGIAGGGALNHSHRISASASISGSTGNAGAHEHYAYIPVDGSQQFGTTYIAGSRVSGSGRATINTSSSGSHNHSMSGSVSINTTTTVDSAGSLPQSTNSSTPGIQITGITANTGPGTGVGTITSQPSTNVSGSAGAGQPVSTIPSNVTVFWIIATRDHAAAEGIDTSFLSAEQMMAILHATAPGPDNPFLTALDVDSFPAGPPGQSAYEAAVAGGFQGTNEQWLNSLNGPAGDSAYVIALQNGFQGTQAEWLASMKGTDGIDGTDGTNGLTAYEVAVINGYTGTAQEWIASLHTVDIPEGTAADVGKYLEKVGPLKNDLAWVTPDDAAEEVVVFNHYPTEAELAALPVDTLVMVGNQTPDQSPFAAAALAYDVETRALGIQMTDGQVRGQVTLPLCEMPMGVDPGQAGMMAPEECLALHNVINTVETLAMGGVFVATYATLALFQATHATVANGYAHNPTEIMPGGRTEGTVNVSDFLFVDQDTDHAGGVTSYILVQDTTTGTKFWTFRRTEDTKIAQATNTSLGIVQGVPVNTTTGATDGKIRIEADGTMSLNGWNRIVENKMDKVSLFDVMNIPVFAEDGTGSSALVDSGYAPSDFATAAQGALADTAMQRPASVVNGNVAQFTANGNVVDSGRPAGTMASFSYDAATSPVESTQNKLVKFANGSKALVASPVYDLHVVQQDHSLTTQAPSPVTADNFAIYRVTGSGANPTIGDIGLGPRHMVRWYGTQGQFGVNNIAVFTNANGDFIHDSDMPMDSMAQWGAKPSKDTAYPELAAGGYIVRTAFATPDKIVAGGVGPGQSLKYEDVKNSLTYSTTETPTGETWVDGRPIYRKVINGTGSPVSGQSTPIGDIGTSNIVSIGGMFRDAQNNVVSAPYVDIAAGISYSIWVTNSGTVNVIVVGSASRLSKPLTVVIEYVK